MERQAMLDAQSLTLLADPRVQAAQARLRDLLARDTQAVGLGAHRLAHVAEEIAFGQVVNAVNADVMDPAFGIFFSPARTSGGLRLPGAKYALSNPDTLFRSFPVDAGGRYRITGRLRDRPPSSLSFHLSGARRGEEGTMRELAAVQDSELSVDGDGRFTLTLGPPGAPPLGPNHIAMEPGANRLAARDTLGDWAAERPALLRLERLDRGQAAPAGDPGAMIAGAIDRSGPAILGFRDRFCLARPANSLPPPQGHPTGNWALTTQGAFDLEPGQALVITLDPLGAAYLGVQLADMATGMLEPEARSSTLNIGQARLNADGTCSFVVAAEDPGVGNWLDSAGYSRGLMMVRWQGLPPGDLPLPRAVRGVAVRPITDLGVDLPKVPPKAREDERASRAAAYGRRFEA